MDELKQKAIEHHNSALMDSMDPMAVMDNMCTDLLSSVEKEYIKEAHSTSRDGNRELISILFRKKEELEPFERFVEAMKKTDANHEIMAEAILKTYTNDEHRNALQAHLRDICQDLDAEDVISYLLAKEIVQDGQARGIMAMPLKPARNMQLITLVKAAGPSAFQEFINALRNGNKGYLAEKMLTHLSSFFTQQSTFTEMTTAKTMKRTQTAAQNEHEVSSNDPCAKRIKSTLIGELPISQASSSSLKDPYLKYIYFLCCKKLICIENLV